jgi:hypothetical protein
MVEQKNVAEKLTLRNKTVFCERLSTWAFVDVFFFLLPFITEKRPKRCFKKKVGGWVVGLGLLGFYKCKCTAG